MCDIFDAPFKGDTASMEHPIFSLSTKPDHRERKYERGDNFLIVKPSSEGLATVHDRDVLIYCISQVMAARNAGVKNIPRKLHLKAYDLLVSTNRGTDGRGYEQLKAALERLKGTTIQTSIKTGGEEQWDIFSLVDRASIKKRDKEGNRSREGRMFDLEITLSDWVINAIESEEVLTLSRQYFQLRKPLERRMYELARKHCGLQPKWQIGLEALREKSGSTSTPKEFKRLVAAIIKDNDEHEHIPDYNFLLEGNIITVSPRTEFKEVYKPKPMAIDRVKLNPAIHEAAKKHAQGWDTYMLEDNWRDMLGQMNQVPEKPEGSFIGYVKWYCKQNGSAR